MSVESTYAEALYEASSDADAVSRVADDLKAFVAAVDSSPELAHTLADPNLDSGTKKVVIAKLTESASPVLSNFLQVLVDRGRLGDLGQITRSYQARVAEATGTIEITAITAVPLDDDMRSKIVQRIERQTGRKAALTERVDEDLIGGLVLEVAEIRVDGSLRSRLDSLRRNLASVPLGATG
ncbi:MAG: ATP synthase F1 subunit delta [Thermoleophilia bacterium]|nr:ATP synthase F1 subunit delta [Thermoleophilia bacterium]